MNRPGAIQRMHQLKLNIEQSSEGAGGHMNVLRPGASSERGIDNFSRRDWLLSTTKHAFDGGAAATAIAALPTPSRTFT